MQKELILKRRCQQVLYDIYEESLEEKTKKRFDEVKEVDPYMNQIIEEVVEYVIYEMPLHSIILETIRGEKHVKR